MERHVYVLAPSGKDAALIFGVLQRAGIAARACTQAQEVVDGAREGIGALIVAEEALTQAPALLLLHHMIEAQPSWSDLPVLLLTRRGGMSPLATAAVLRLGNVTVVDRPTTVATLVSAVRTALRTRERQYDLRQADLRKDTFLATLAHELRNPLAPLSNALHLLQAAELPQPAQRWAVGVMQRQTQQLTRLVDDLLDVARITRGKVALQREALDLRDAVHAAIETSLPLIEGMQHELVVDLPQQPVWAHADRTRIAQCVANLLTNAAKYTPRRGRIEVALWREERRARISVSDNGIGFVPEQSARLFEVFAQVEDAMSRAQGGLGLGLSIVKALMALHDGEVSADSAGPGRGATFTLGLPLPEGAGPPPQEPAPAVMPGQAQPAPAGCRVLVVDDNRDSADSMSELLRSCGHDVRTAYDARAALALVADWAPQVALLDIGLPDMSGHDLARELRLARPAGAPVLVALTGWGQAADIQRSSDAGFTHHLTKPADIGGLLGVVDEVARQGSPSQ